MTSNVSDASFAWNVLFDGEHAFVQFKGGNASVRAVRGGM